MDYKIDYNPFKWTNVAQYRPNVLLNGYHLNKILFHPKTTTTTLMMADDDGKLDRYSPFFL